jgi:hypothetical protein
MISPPCKHKSCALLRRLQLQLRLWLSMLLWKNWQAVC